MISISENFPLSRIRVLPLEGTLCLASGDAVVPDPPSPLDTVHVLQRRTIVIGITSSRTIAR